MKDSICTSALPYTGTFPIVAPGKLYTGIDANARNTLYLSALAAAADPSSELYHRERGTIYRHGGASHREEFWRGFDGIRSFAAPTSHARVMHRAGREFRKAVDACSALPRALWGATRTKSRKGEPP